MTTQLIIVSGYSGSGKSAVLHCLEDQGYYCIDNLPGILFSALFDEIKRKHKATTNFAVSIDARNLTQDLTNISSMLEPLKACGVACKIIFLEAEPTVLIKRYSETGRKHPLSTQSDFLEDAIQKEHQLLLPLSLQADLRIDSTCFSLHQLRDSVRQLIDQQQHAKMVLQIQSFGFKHGIPLDSDCLFDVRCLPNPYWVPSLRAYSGLDKPVQEFLAPHQQVQQMLKDIIAFMERWLPTFEKNNRSYFTLSIGCTGGQHRSVYLSEQLAQRLSTVFSGPITTRHKHLTQ